MKTLSDPRTDAICALVSSEHFRFRRVAGALATPGEVELNSSWALNLDAPSTPLTERMIADFRTFCSSCLSLPFNPNDRAADDAPRIVWQLLCDERAGHCFDRQDPETEAFELEITSEHIAIRARHERGLLHGTHRLEWMMADRGGPFLTPQHKPFLPTFMPRISNGIFIPGHQRVEEPGHFPDAYLGLMSHYGVNGIHLYLDLWSVFRSNLLPELNAEKLDERIAALRELNRRTLFYGIDLYLHLNTPPLAEDHLVFKAHPEVRGALVEIFIEGLSGRPWYNLCSGHPTVLAAYGEAIENLFTLVPEAAGAIMIIGGECFYHCYTRPAKASNGMTNCSHCMEHLASPQIARLVNTVTRAVKKTGSHKALYAWSYSAFVWSADDPHQLDWIDHLDPDVSVLANFDGGDEVGGGVRCFDYNITQIGPSALFVDQARHLHEKNRPIFAKTETSTTPEAFFLPYLPVHYRWLARFESMRKSGVAGFIGQWRFFGMNGSLPEELQYRVIWEQPVGDRWLEIIARRRFNLETSAIRDVMGGWRLLSEAWGFFPYSAMTCGERAGYMRGPFYLGPAHPLIFDVQGGYDLPASFRVLRGDLAEMAPEELEELQHRAKPRYVSDLLVTLPYGVDSYLERLEQCRSKWKEGLILLRKHLACNGAAAQGELDVCETILCHLATLENVVRFYHARDQLQSQAQDVKGFKKGVNLLMEIARQEIANAERMLPILERDPRIGYGYCYGPVYDASMVKAKIAQCRFVHDVELPRYSSIIRFHVWLDSP